MFDKFGEFDSHEEINRAAAAQREEGDTEAILMIAEENGLDREDAEDFCTGAIEELTTPLLAAEGKLKIEAEDLKANGLIADWKDHVLQLCAEDNELCLAVRRKGKRLEQCLGKLLEYAFKNKAVIDGRIVKAAGLTPPIYLGVPGRAEARKIIRKYYLGEEK